MRIARKNVKNIEELDQWLQGTRKINFKNYFKDKKPTVEDIYKYTNSAGPSSINTYFKNGSVQAAAGKYRSMNDIILLIKFYYPEKSIRDCIKDITVLYYAQCDAESYGPGFWFCPDVNRHNFRGNTYMGRPAKRNFLNYLKRDFKREFTGVGRIEFDTFFDDIHKECM